MTEQICPRCGCGMTSGWQYACCADFPTAEERVAAHRALCGHFARVTCESCDEEMELEEA